MKPAKRIRPRHLPLLEMFLNEYEAMRQKMDAEAMPALLEIAPLIFGKWYHSALVAETILSPANIISKDLEKSGSCSEFAYVLRTHPRKQGAGQYTFSLYEYSLEAHPLVEDMKTLVGFCYPDCRTDEQGFLLPQAREILLPRLSIPEGFYLEYLTRLAWLAGLLLPMPAIHTHKMQPSASCREFFAQGTAEIIRQLAETACALAAERFVCSMHLEDGVATPVFFRSCLETHMDVDKIFIDFYERVDVNILEIWQTPPGELSEDEHNVISSFLFTGIMLDKWFLTPMSMFFRLIRPLAFIPMRFFPLVNHVAAMLLMERNWGSEVFTPPAYYSLTALGKALFAVPEGAGENRQEMPESLPYEQILDAMEQEADVRRRERAAMLKTVPEIVSMKVSLMQDDEVWKIIEAGSSISLHEFCLDLCAAFGMEGAENYMLSVPDRNGFPMEYSPAGSKRSVNKTAGLALRDLPLSAGMHLRLSPSPAGGGTLLLDILAQGEGNPFLIYPRICRQSRKVTEQEREDEMF